MGKKKQEESSGGGAPEWMVTFSDMMTLLLTFFVLLLSMSTMDEEKAKVALGSLKGAMGVLEKANDITAHKDAVFFPFMILKTIKTKAGTATQKLIYDNIQGKIQELGLMNKLEMGLDDRGIYIRIEDEVLFSSGNAKLSVASKLFLSKLASIFDQLPYDIVVEGHTDDSPIATSSYRDNWELSVQRSLSVLYLFADKGISESRLSAVGYSSNKPLVPNTTKLNRAKNRRIELVLQEPDKVKPPLSFPEERLAD